MPGPSYRPQQNPASWWDSVFAHAHGLSLSIAAVVVGSLGLAGQLWPGFDPAPALAHQPLWAALGVGVLLIGGGVALGAAYTLIWLTHGHRVDAQRTGLSMQAFGWASWSVAIWSAPGQTYWTAIALSSMAAVGCALSWWGTFRGVADLRRQVLRMKGDIEKDEGAADE